ncbi:hypothetical protein B0H14DRAFT_3434085 [Mycena olivaceomarginata]|nr:hypothetical protein B0H14DRAFT_3434085 [Mycena olivaceomarginata]
MFLAPRRPVFIANTTAMDEGHLSEFDNVYGLLALVNDPDEYFPMSFHLLHCLGTGVVLNVTIAPMAYEHSRKLGWEYRLINITVVGCREDDALSSPSKYVVKRKAVILDRRLVDETPVSKKLLRGARPVRKRRCCRRRGGERGAKAAAPNNQHTNDRSAETTLASLFLEQTVIVAGRILLSAVLT